MVGVFNGYANDLATFLDGYDPAYEYQAAAGALVQVARALAELPIEPTLREIVMIVAPHKPLFQKTSQDLRKLKKDLSPEGQEAIHKERTRQAVDLALREYNGSYEGRALRLLELVCTGATAESKEVQRLIKDLRRRGAEGVKSLFLTFNPALHVQQRHLDTIAELFKADAAKRTNSADTANTGAGSESEINPAGASEPTIHPQVPEDIRRDPDIVALYLEEAFGIPLLECERLAENERLTTARIEAVQRTFQENGLVPNTANAILRHNPGLLDPESGVDLQDFCKQLALFVRLAAGHMHINEFNPAVTPSNFSSPEALRKTFQGLRDLESEPATPLASTSSAK
jgi:hypothetical protein